MNVNDFGSCSPSCNSSFVSAHFISLFTRVNQRTVRVIDELVRELSAPEYAKTDEEQVHNTRLAISSLMPHFIIQQPVRSGEESSTGLPYTVDPAMSPLEAVYVTRFLIMQKETNESSLITPTERAELKAKIKKLTDSGFQLTGRERNAVMAALIGQKLHTETPQLTVEELATRARQRKQLRDFTNQPIYCSSTMKLTH